MVKNKISPQQKWNNKHKDIIRKDSRRYYRKHTDKVKKHMRIHLRHKRLERRREQRKKANV